MTVTNTKLDKLEHVRTTDPEVARAIEQEIKRQEEGLELIASENFTSLAVMEAQGSVMTNKYAEGYPAKRWYNGCENVDIVETLAIERAKTLFGAEHANVQPHSGSSANLAVYFSILNPGDSVVAMSLDHGGHLTHGHPMNFSGRYYKIHAYGVHPKTEYIDYDAIGEIVEKIKPKLLVAGASAYPRIIDAERLRAIADKVNAYLMVDMAHFAGLVAAGLHPNPVKHAHFVTTTTHKTLRGPRGGIILCQERFSKDIDAQVFPGIQGGPLMHVIAAKAVMLKEALLPSFKKYQEQVLKNSKTLASTLNELGWRIVSGGTDNHLLLLDLGPKGLIGKDAANALHVAGITVNKNLIPFDKQSPFKTSGIRIGSPAVTTRGMKENEMRQIASFISDAIMHMNNETHLKTIHEKVTQLCRQFPLYPELS